MKLLIQIIALALLLNSCSKTEVVLMNQEFDDILIDLEDELGIDTENIPNCFWEILEEFQNDELTCSQGASVAEYIFSEETVFLLDAGPCISDGFTIVIDTNCEIIGYLNGFAGITEVVGVEFWPNSEYIQEIWGN